MPAELEIGDLFGDIDRLIDAAASTANQLDQPHEKAFLSAVVDKLRLARKDAAEVIPAKLQELKAFAEGQAAETKRLQTELERQSQEVERQMAAAAAKAPVVAPPAVPRLPAVPDPALGSRLRDELLSRFGPPAGVEPPPFRPGKDIWEDWK